TLITGASSGIGAAFAEKLAQFGTPLILVARSEERLAQLATKLTAQHKTDVRYITADLTVREAPEAIKKQCDAWDIQVSFLINNAGYGKFGEMKDIDRMAQSKMVDLNCRAVVDLATIFLPPMIERKNGAMIITSSVGGYQATPFYATYGATKAFDLIFGESLWAELRPYNVDVLVLSPGATESNFHAVARNSTRLLDRGLDTAEAVVQTALDSLGKRLSVVHGAKNRMLVFLNRLVPRSMAAQFSYNYSKLK
ncbi:hypothetical protein MNBD_CHLOROFLEXI01-2604, partial [hydrothermal vent metagenome]